MLNLKFPPRLLYEVLDTVREQGFCVLGAEQIERLLSRVQGGVAEKRQALEEFAALSGLQMETTPNLNAARFEHAIANKTMNLTLPSPVADVMMSLSEIEPGLVVYKCPQSGGVWIPLQSYLVWRKDYAHLVKNPSTNGPAVTDDSKRPALLCPESGHLLIRYKVGHGLPFHIDVSPKTGGIWLDAGEWEALKCKGLHIELNHVFTTAYQRQVRVEEHEEALGRLLREKIGYEDFERAAEFKRWVSVHPKRAEIIGFLLQDLAENP